MDGLSRRGRCCPGQLLLRVFVSLTLAIVPIWAQCAAELVSSYHVPDRQFPQLERLWQPPWTLGTLDDAMPTNAPLTLGGYVFVYIRNTGSAPLTISDLSYQGIKLSEGFGRSRDRQSAVNLPGHSIFLSKLPEEQIQVLDDAGEPIWWKPDPRTIPAGGYGEVVLRLRRAPASGGALELGVITDNGSLPVRVEQGRQHPRFESISFHPKLTTTQMYLRHSPNTKLAKLFVDDQEITKDARIGTDESLGITAVVYWPPKPFGLMSYHCARAVFSDGSVATAGTRAWGNDFVYGMWGAAGDPKAFYQDLALHNVNAHMGHAQKDVTEMSLSAEGFDFLKRLGIRTMASWVGNARDPLFYLLMDEPDAHDPEIDDLESRTHLGCLAQGLVGRMEEMRSKDPNTPILLNVNNTDTPQNWYTYHQLSDIPSIDPYYPEQLDGAYRRHPGLMMTRHKPTYVYAAARISHWAGAPKPLHTILCSTRYVPKDWKPGEYAGRFPTPEEKRIEVFYAIAGGAKGLSYWWFSQDAECQGLGMKDAASMALWREIGLLGAEVRTAGSVITMGCPADLRIKAPSGLVARALVSGLETVAVMAINDDILCDRVGTAIRATKGSIAVEVPAWIDPKDAFEVTSDGIRSVDWKKNGRSVALELGPVDLTRFVLITSDGGLRGQLDQVYKNKFAENVAALKARP